MELGRSSGSEGEGGGVAEGDAGEAGIYCREPYFDYLIREPVSIRRKLYRGDWNSLPPRFSLRLSHFEHTHRVLRLLGQEEAEEIFDDEWGDEEGERIWDDGEELDDYDGRRWRFRACACILANLRFMDQANSFSLASAAFLILRQPAAPRPSPVFICCGSELSHAKLLLHVRCGPDSFAACRLVFSDAHERVRLHWVRAIIARVQLYRRSRMLETLHGMTSIVYNGHAYKTLAGHIPHSYDPWVEGEYGKLRSLDAGWQLCPDTPDARHICGSYPWASNTLVFADGRAYFTKKADLQHFAGYHVRGLGVCDNFNLRNNFLNQLLQSLVPGAPACAHVDCHLVQKCGQYGVPPMDERDTDDLDRMWNDMLPDVLLRRSLPS
jgi:hypothetical protein